MEVKDLSCLSSNKIVYCTMEVDGGDKLQTDQAEASKPWSRLSAAAYSYLIHTHTHTRTHARTYARTHAHTHTHTPV